MNRSIWDTIKLNNGTVMPQFGLGCFNAVSYTHLDVYKRQAYKIPGCSGCYTVLQTIIDLLQTEVISWIVHT